MYSHKKSFTGQSSRSFAALFDLPFLLNGGVIIAIFSVIHSFATHTRLPQHIRNWPDALTQMPQATLATALRESTRPLQWELLLSTWTGMFLPLLLIGLAVRWTLGSLRISVQRTVTLSYVFAFYFFSFMTTALHNADWTPGNLLVRMLHPFGEEFFKSLRAILCMSLVGAGVFTLAKNATSKIDRSLRLSTAAAVFLIYLAFDYTTSKRERDVHESFLKHAGSAKFIFVLPGLKPADVPQALADTSLKTLKEQLSSFQEIHPSTPGLLGQFITSFLGLEPTAHGVRHDFTDEELVANAQESIRKKLAITNNSELNVFAIGGPSPLRALFASTVPGIRCGQSLEELASLGHFQTSIIPYALSPGFIDGLLHRDLLCSNRFLTLEQSLFQTYQNIIEKMHIPGGKTFLVWLAHPTPKTSLFAAKPDAAVPSTTAVLLRNHLSFLQATGLQNHHQTFLVGLTADKSSTTAFVRFDGQSNSTLTDLTLESPGQRAQSSVAELLRGQTSSEEKDSPYFYSELNPADSLSISALPPTITQLNSQTNVKEKERLVVNLTQVRSAVVNSKRHVICQNVESENDKQLSVRVSLTLQGVDNRLPQLFYEDVEHANLPEKNETMSLQDCLDNARERLLRSVIEDVSLRDSASFKTLLTGLPVKSIRTSSQTTEQSLETEEALDQSTSNIPDAETEEQEQ